MENKVSDYLSGSDIDWLVHENAEVHATGMQFDSWVDNEPNLTTVNKSNVNKSNKSSIATFETQSTTVDLVDQHNQELRDIISQVDLHSTLLETPSTKDIYQVSSPIQTFLPSDDDDELYNALTSAMNEKFDPSEFDSILGINSSTTTTDLIPENQPVTTNRKRKRVAQPLTTIKKGVSKQLALHTVTDSPREWSDEEKSIFFSTFLDKWPINDAASSAIAFYVNSQLQKKSKELSYMRWQAFLLKQFTTINTVLKSQSSGKSSGRSVKEICLFYTKLRAYLHSLSPIQDDQETYHSPTRQLMEVRVAFVCWNKFRQKRAYKKHMKITIQDPKTLNDFTEELTTAIQEFRAAQTTKKIEPKKDISSIGAIHYPAIRKKRKPIQDLDDIKVSDYEQLQAEVTYDVKIAYTTPTKHTKRSRQSISSTATVQKKKTKSSKILKIRCIPLNKATRARMIHMNFNPKLELTVKSSKSVIDIAIHLEKKWKKENFDKISECIQLHIADQIFTRNNSSHSTCRDLLAEQISNCKNNPTSPKLDNVVVIKYSWLRFESRECITEASPELQSLPPIEILDALNPESLNRVSPFPSYQTFKEAPLSENSLDFAKMEQENIGVCLDSIDFDQSELVETSLLLSTLTNEQTNINWKELNLCGSTPSDIDLNLHFSKDFGNEAKSYTLRPRKRIAPASILPNIENCNTTESNSTMHF